MAAIAITATVSSEIAFGVEEHKKKKELTSAISSAQKAIQNANDFYQNVYKVVKTRLEHLKQNVRKLPTDAVTKLNQELQLNLGDSSKAVYDAGLALGGTEGALGLFSLVSFGLTRAGIIVADGIVANFAAVAGAVGGVLAVVGFGLTLYNGITALHKLNEAIDKVNNKRQQAEDVISKMKKSLDGLLKALHIDVGKYETLKDISNDWSQLAQKVDKYSTAFYSAMIGFCDGKGR